MVELSEKKEKIIVTFIGGQKSGKSTMIGHILVKERLVDTRLLKKLEEEVESRGKPESKYALLTLKTEAEKADGHTRDVTTRKIQTKRRIITLFDVPGHWKYSKNMIVGT